MISYPAINEEEAGEFTNVIINTITRDSNKSLRECDLPSVCTNFNARSTGKLQNTSIHNFISYIP